MRRSLFALLFLTGSACSGAAAVTTESSSSSTFGGIGGIGGIGAGNTSATTGTHLTSSNSTGSTGASGSGVSVTGSGSSGASNAASNSNGNGSSGNASSNGSATTAAGTTGSTSGGSTNGSTNVGASSTGGSCIADNMFVGIGNGAMCCSGAVTSAGYCQAAGASVTSTTGSPTTGNPTTAASTNGSTGTIGTTGAGSTGATSGGGTGTTTGGTCPMNIPNLETGETTTVAGSCTETGESSCPPGFSCVNRQCVLHGSDGQLQMTLSWDDAEDIDLHVVEPQGSGTCEIWYGNVGNRQYPDGGLDAADSNTGICTPVGWLDRDSNPGCELDNVDVENVIYPPNVTPPSGTYTVRADFYADCNEDGFGSVPEYAEINYALQVRRNGQVFLYCGSFAGGSDDSGSEGSGVTKSTFTLP